MHFKRKRPKNRRAGCLMCKSHKMNGWGNRTCCDTSNGRREVIARDTLARYLRGEA